MLVRIVICWSLLLCLSCACYAQPVISRNVIANGGSDMGNGAYRIVGTAGQSFIGVSSESAWTAGQGFWYQVQLIPTTAEELVVLPASPVLHQNYPNPFNPLTTIEFTLPSRSTVQLALYGPTGILLGLLVDGIGEAGRHRVRFEASDLPAGVYLCRLTVGPVVRERKMLLLK